MEFKNYTCSMNEGFKIKIGFIVLSLSFHDYNMEESHDADGHFIRPDKVLDFTFNNASVCIFRTDKDKENMSEYFAEKAKLEGYDMGIIRGIEPLDLVKLLVLIVEEQALT